MDNSALCTATKMDARMNARHVCSRRAGQQRRPRMLYLQAKVGQQTQGSKAGQAPAEVERWP